jgi:PAS domain S-box-containing protein
MQLRTELRSQIRPFLRLQTAMLGAAVLILSTMVGLAYLEWKEYRSARATGLRVLAVQNSVESLVSTLLEAEAGQRGFLITGDDHFLEPHLRAVRSAPAELNRLAALLRSPGGTPDPMVVRLTNLVNQELSHDQRAVELRQRTGGQAAAEFVAGEGRATIDEIRRVASEVRRRIETERSGVQVQALAANRGALLVTIAGALVLLVLLIVGYRMISRRTLEREEALSGMRSLHELGVRLTKHDHLPTLLGETLRVAEAITHADMGNIQLLDAAGALRIEAQHGFSAEFLDFFNAVHNNQAACGTALERHERVVVADVVHSPIFAGTPALKVLFAAGVRAVQSTPMIGRSGEVVGVLSTHYRRPHRPSDPDLRLLDLLARQAADLIEEYRADQALRESEERYRATFNNAAVGIAHVGLDGQWLRFNDAVCEIIGYSREELSSGTFAEITHPDDIQANLAMVRRVLNGEIQTFSIEKRYIRKDSSVVWVILTVSLMCDNSGAPRYFVSVIEDISERKEAEQELRRTKEQLQLVADNMAAAVSQCSRDLRYVWVSRGFADWLGTVPERIAGRPIADVLGPQGYDDIRPHVERVLAGDRVEHTTPVNLPGGRRWIHSIYVPTYAHPGEVDGFIAVDLDITEERRTAEQLRQTQRLESLGVLAGGIAHDFNNLLVGVLGNASLALEVLGPTTIARRMLEDVVCASERAAALTRQLLAYAGKEQLATRPINLATLVTELTGLLRASIPKNVHLALETDDRLPYVDADQTQLQQVIMNLVINGAEAIPEKSPGTVTITATARKATPEDRMFALAPLAPGDVAYVVLTVTDPGTGMTPEVQSRIFDPFFTTKFEGRGLGLSAVLGIVKAHQGAITLKTAPGAGTTIALLLPASREVVTADLPRPARPSRVGGTVLVVDDEATVRSVARRVLEHKRIPGTGRRNRRRGPRNGGRASGDCGRGARSGDAADERRSGRSPLASPPAQSCDHPLERLSRGGGPPQV